jgi:hypothetical protein
MLFFMKHPLFVSKLTHGGNRTSSNTHSSNTTFYNRNNGSNATPNYGISATSNNGSIKFPIVKITQFHTMGAVKQLHVLQNEMLLTVGKLEVIHNDQVMGDTCDAKTVDHFHDFGTPILQCYKNIHISMVTNT